MLQQFYPQPPAHGFRFQLDKDMDFCAAHFVPHEGAGNCQYMHGHTYSVNLTIAGDQLDEMGFLANFGTLKKLVHGRFDHKVLNQDALFTGSFDEPSDFFPTTELLAEAIWQIVDSYLQTKENRVHCLQVIVRETPTSYVTYRPAGGVIGD